MNPAPRRLALVLLTAWTANASAQDFVCPATAGPSQSPLAFVERGLSPSAPGAAIEVGATRWFGLSDLATRSLAVGLGWRSLRAAGGISQTGDRELGWSAAGLACGMAHAVGGAAVRAGARRDRTTSALEAQAGEGTSTGEPPADTGGLPAGVGVEAGGGVWVAAGSRIALWASAPQLWTRGASPPLARTLEIGGSLVAGEISLWLMRTAPTPGGSSRLAAGTALAGGPWMVWIEARDRPLRGTVGVSARAGRLRASAAVDGHPVLGETVKLSLGWFSGGRGS